MEAENYEEFITERKALIRGKLRHLLVGGETAGERTAGRDGGEAASGGSPGVAKPVTAAPGRNRMALFA